MPERGLALPNRLELGRNETVKQGVIGGMGVSAISPHAPCDELRHHRHIRVLEIEGRCP